MMEYGASAMQREMTTEHERKAAVAPALGERAVRRQIETQETRIGLNRRAQQFIATTLGEVCDEPQTPTQIQGFAERIEQLFVATANGVEVPNVSLMIQLAVIGQEPADISRFVGISEAATRRHLRMIRMVIAAADKLVAETIEPAVEEVVIPAEPMVEIAVAPVARAPHVVVQPAVPVVPVTPVPVATPPKPTYYSPVSGQRLLHQAERDRQADEVAEQLAAHQAQLEGTDWECRQAELTVGGDRELVAIFRDWCAGVSPEALTIQYRRTEGEGYVRRQLLRMAKAARRPMPAAAHPRRDSSWKADALCAQTDPEAFFPEKGGSTHDAKKVCDNCTVQVQCGAAADAMGEQQGVWGKRSARERKRVRA